MLFLFTDKLHNSVYFTVNTEGNMLSYAKTTNSRIEWVTGAHKRTSGDSLLLTLPILGLS